MAISVYNLQEQIVARIGNSKAEPQALIQAIKNAYAKITFLEWAKGKLEGVSEILGGSVYTFTDITPELDISNNKYYAIIPSTYVSIPHDMGIVQISYVKGENRPFVRMSAGLSSLFSGLLANALGNNQTYEVVGNKMYFPKMQKNEVGDITMKLSVAFSDDVDEELNISPNIAEDIINMVVQQFAPLPKVMPDTLTK